MSIWQISKREDNCLLKISDAQKKVFILVELKKNERLETILLGGKYNIS